MPERAAWALPCSTATQLEGHGTRIPTGDHLARAHDLNYWGIADVGHDRHLVTAADLIPWYSGHPPRSRHDFGPLILTEDIIAIHPAPWRKP